MGPVLAVARHEARHVGRFATPSVLVGAVALALLGVVLAPGILERGVQSGDGIHPVEVDPAARLAPAIAADSRFRPAGGADAVLEVHAVAGGADRVLAGARHQSAEAALADLGQAARAWDEARLALEPDRAAAFPVEVAVFTQERAAVARIVGAAPTGAPQRPDGPEGQSPADPVVGPQSVGTPGRTGLRPTQVEPPFPMRSLLLAFAYVIPMNFVAQLQAGTLHADRVRRRGLTLLSAPVRPVAVLAGRVVPYAVLTLAVWSVASLAIGTRGWGVVAGLAVAVFVLASSILVGLLARSERDVTFLLTAVTTGFTTFLFLPAVFSAVPAIALLSPVTLVSAGIRDQAVPTAGAVYALVPTLAMAGAMAWLAVGLYREETLFAPRGLLSKASDALATMARGRWAVFSLGALAVPWAFTFELSLMALAVPLGLGAAVVAVVVGAGFVEEGLKSWVGVAHRRATAASAWTTGLLVGTAFWLGERIAFVLVLLQFDQLPGAAPALATFGLAGPVTAVLPWLVHVGAATIGCAAAREAVARRRLAWLGASVLHASHNVLAMAVAA